MPPRIIPQLPPADQQLRLVIDTDAANEIDDLYAIALAVYSPDRFSIEGIVATHFAAKAGRGSIEESHDLILKLLDAGGKGSEYRVVKGGDPIPYADEPVDSDGARLIVERANAGTSDNPLWVVGLGAASNLASALLLDPTIVDKVRYVFHARSEWSWPNHSEQFNVGGDIQAARCLLRSRVPLVWFDTGQQLTIPMAITEEKLLPLGGMPAFLHQYRSREPGYQTDTKGFYDVGDIAWLIDPDVCTNETVDVPHMDFKMHFSHRGDLGQMVRASEVRAEAVWEMFWGRVKRGEW